MDTPPVSPISPTIPTEMETPHVEPESISGDGEPQQEPTDAVEEASSSPPDSRGAIFIDSCVLGFSYLWLGCGGIVLVLFVLGVLASFLLRRA